MTDMDNNVRSLCNKRVRVELNEPGVHPFLSLSIPDGEGGWFRAACLGARQLKYQHKGSSFPRVVSGGEEEEAGAKLDFIEGVAGGRGITVSDIRGGFEINSRIVIEDDSPVVRVEHRLTALADMGVNRAFDRYDFVAAPGGESGSELDDWFAPHLRPRTDMVIGDHVFRSPVVMMKRGDIFFALIPDLEAMEREYRRGAARYYMDFLVSGGENKSPATCFGVGNTRRRGHVYFKGDFGRPVEVPEGGTLTLPYYLFLDRDGTGKEDMLTFLWERFGRRYFESGLPQVVGLDRYASAGLTRIFKKPDVFIEFELDGQRCGGSAAQYLLTRRGVQLMSARELRGFFRIQDIWLAAFRLGVKVLTISPRANQALERFIWLRGPKVPPQVMLQSWFNNLRSAYGAYWFARKWKDHALLENSLSVKNLALLAPREGGAFPAICFVTEEGVSWSRGTRAFEHLDFYHTADCATTAYYMLLWFRDLEGDPRLLGRAHEFADFLLKVQMPSGAIPAWVHVDGSSPVADPALRESATTACPAMFLAMLYLVDGDEKHLEAAIRAGDFLAQHVIPRHKWFDYETFYSCGPKKLDMFDSFTATYPQNTMSMIWAAEALRLLHIATGEARWLELGLEVLNHLCLYQQVWDPPFLSINAFGGFASQNSDGEWNDARQALAVPILMDYYRLTGRAELMERGIAALRASFTTMYIDENRRVAPGNLKSFPAWEEGSTAENYGHQGYDHKTPGFFESDWGTGSACHAAAYAQKHYGDIFVDLGRARAFGINGCRVTGFDAANDRLSIAVKKQIEGSLEAVIRVEGAASPRLEVEVNGAPAKRTSTGDFLALL